MLLVTFHGGPTPGINKVYCYNTTSKVLVSDQVLIGIDSSNLSELRSLIYDNGYLYVSNGGKSVSNVLTFQHQASSQPYQFSYISDFVDSITKNGDFTTSIAHPFALAFDGHSYKVEIAVEGPVNPETGWLIDFGVIDDAWAPLFARFDHHNLNDVPGLENSTCENIAIYLWRALGAQIAALSAVTVWETYDSKCTYRGG